MPPLLAENFDRLDVATLPTGWQNLIGTWTVVRDPYTDHTGNTGQVVSFPNALTPAEAEDGPIVLLTGIGKQTDCRIQWSEAVENDLASHNSTMGVVLRYDDVAKTGYLVSLDTRSGQSGANTARMWKGTGMDVLSPAPTFTSINATGVPSGYLGGDATVLARNGNFLDPGNRVVHQVEIEGSTIRYRVRRKGYPWKDWVATQVDATYAGPGYIGFRAAYGGTLPISQLDDVYVGAIGEVFEVYNQYDLVTATGTKYTVLEPRDGLSASTPRNVVVYFHGTGEGEHAPLSDTVRPEMFKQYLALGYLIVLPRQMSPQYASYGNSSGITETLGVFDAVRDRWSVGKVVLQGVSAGALGAANILKNQGIADVMGLVAEFGVLNLAWAQTSGLSTYVAAAYPAGFVGHDPMTFDWVTLAPGKRFMTMASPTDTAVSKVQNSDAFGALVRPSALEVSQYACTGTHADASGWWGNYGKYVAFLQRCFASTSGAASSSVVVIGYADGMDPASQVLASAAHRLAVDASGHITVGGYAAGQDPASMLMGADIDGSMTLRQVLAINQATIAGTYSVAYDSTGMVQTVHYYRLDGVTLLATSVMTLDSSGRPISRAWSFYNLP